MGVIQRQGIKNSIVSYIGVLIGAVNYIFIYPLISTEQLGVIQFIMLSANFLGPTAILGLSSTVIKYFPLFRDKDKGHHGFLFFITVSSILALCISIGFIVAFKGLISGEFKDQAKYFEQYLPHILVLTAIIGLMQLYSNYITNFLRIVVPNILINLTIKISLPILVLLYLHQFIVFKTIYHGIIVAHLFVLVGLLWYIYYIGQFFWQRDFSMLSKKLVKEMFTFSGFNMLTQPIPMFSARAISQQFCMAQTTL